MVCMKKIIKIIFFPVEIIFLFFIYLYKWCISPLLPKTCRFYPSCSTYAVMAIKEFGIFKGICLAISRICRCRPNGKYGFDPIPQNIKGDSKWIV